MNYIYEIWSYCLKISSECLYNVMDFSVQIPMQVLKTILIVNSTSLEIIAVSYSSLKNIIFRFSNPISNFSILDPKKFCAS